MSAEQQWHLDKRVPIALIFTMIGQVAAVSWFGAMLIRDVEANTIGLVEARQEYRQSLTDMRNRVTTVERSAEAQAVQMSRVATQLEGQGKTLDRIDETLSELIRYLRAER